MPDGSPLVTRQHGLAANAGDMSGCGFATEY